MIQAIVIAVVVVAVLGFIVWIQSITGDAKRDNLRADIAEEKADEEKAKADAAVRGIKESDLVDADRGFFRHLLGRMSRNPDKDDPSA